VLLTLRGTPFLYAGEELGLDDAEVPELRRVDPGHRDGCRAPLPWTAAPGHGWPAEPWLPWPPAATTRNVASQREDDDSILHLYRRLLAARRTAPALQVGTWRLLDAPPDVLAYERAHAGDTRRVFANYGEEAATVVVTGEWVVDISTTRRREHSSWDGSLGPTEAIVVRSA
jgi:alpha-glucosidase